jgi:hypothetical protein
MREKLFRLRALGWALVVATGATILFVATWRHFSGGARAPAENCEQPAASQAVANAVESRA